MTSAVETLPPSRSAARDPAWPIYAVLIASAFIVIGLIWDISWHRSIGRDTFWSPPHMLEQAAAIIAGLSCGWIVLHTTFAGTPDERARSVRFWGFYGPLGAFVCIWGTLMMITSAPFDNWWHNAYGLDVKIISPPHMVLAWGMLAIQVGAVITALGRQNRAPEAHVSHFGHLYVATAALLMTMHATVLLEEAAFANHMRASRFYMIVSILFPAILTATARLSRVRWGATKAAAIYIALELCIMWALQLSPATPKLAPIFNAVTNMIPQPFPLLLIVPAFAIDLLHARPVRSDWMRAASIGATYVVLMVAVHWYFSGFLLSPGARNFFFGVDQWDYNIQLGNWRYEFWGYELGPSGQWSPLRFFGGCAIAMGIATLSSRIGLGLGAALAKVRR
ncbi:MAG TPA: hypothetical protein VJR92_00075 [Gemmatimonadaceae bacterium]|nr:hypothetical protein [Gemmatimonadaceae bacterium]